MYSIDVKLDFNRENSINIFNAKYKHGRFLKKEKNVYSHSSEYLELLTIDGFSQPQGQLEIEKKIETLFH